MLPSVKVLESKNMLLFLQFEGGGQVIKVASFGARKYLSSLNTIRHF